MVEFCAGPLSYVKVPQKTLHLDQWVLFFWCMEFNWVLVFLPKVVEKGTYTSNKNKKKQIFVC